MDGHAGPRHLIDSVRNSPDGREDSGATAMWFTDEVSVPDEIVDALLDDRLSSSLCRRVSEAPSASHSSTCS